MAVPQADLLPTAPTRADPNNFAARADAFFLALTLFVAQLNAIIAAINAAVTAAAASAASALMSPGTSATSTSSITIGTGSKTLAIQAGKLFVVGQFVTFAVTGSPGNYMVGQVTAIDTAGGSITIQVTYASGAGTFAAWTVSLSSPMQFIAATAAQLWTGTDSTTVATPAGLAAAAAPVALADAATITPDLNAGLNLTLTIGGSRTLANPTNAQPGDGGLIVITQDATGGRALAFGSAWKFPGGAPSLSTAAGAVDAISYQVISPTVILCTLIRGFA